MKNLKKVLLLAGLAGSLSCVALGQILPYKIVKIPNTSPNTLTAINNAGQVMVNYDSPIAFTVSVWSLETKALTPALTSGNNTGAAMNESGAIAGAGQTNQGYSQAFLWLPDGGDEWLGTLGGPISAANALNASREVVGMSYTSTGLQHAFLWKEGSGMEDLTPSLTSMGGATATAINTSGEVAGYFYPNGSTSVYGFTWTAQNGISSLPANTLAYGLNDSGTVVGQLTTAQGYRHAFSWTSAGGLVDLGTLGGSMSTALGINSKGWIVGTSLTNDKTGLLHGFLWIPGSGMQDYVTLAKLGTGAQPYSAQINDYGDIAISTHAQTTVLVPTMTATATGSPNPSVLGQSITITATVTSIAGPPPNGEILDFSVDGRAAGTGTMTNGVAQCTVSGLKVGTHTVALVYNGDAYYLPFRYTPLQLVVNQ